MGRSFYVYRRASSGIYYAEILGPRGERLASRSTGKTNRDEAVLLADGWARKGFPDSSGKVRPVAESLALDELLGIIRSAELTPPDALRIVDLLRSRELLEKAGPLRAAGASRITVQTFAAEIFAEGSEYMVYRARRGRPLSNNHRRHAEAALRVHLLPLIGGDRLADLTAARLERLQDELLTRPRAGGGAKHLDGSPANRKPEKIGILSPRSANYCMQILRLITKWAQRKGLIYADPFKGIEPLAQAIKVRRGILTPEETARLFALEPDPWPVYWARIFFLIARYTGLRKGELQALRMGSFFERLDDASRAFAVVRVSGAWDRVAFKAPKNGRERVAIVPPSAWPEVRAFLEGLGKLEPAALVFEGEAPGRPVSPGRIDYALRRALAAIGIEAEARLSRKLSAHSFRYQANSELVNAGISLTRVQALLGHVSGDAMTANYYQAGEDFGDVIAAMEPGKKNGGQE